MGIKHFIIFTIKMGSIHTSGDQYRNYQDDRSAKAEDTIYTASNGAPVPHPYEAQRAGENGPLLLQDFHLIDLLSHFDRERIPERVVHAKGSGAHGVYRTTDTLEDLCLADMFQPGKECPITVRFSTVGGESGSHDCARDPRGFSVKFRTDEGNWDLVANNTPVFFLRDPAKFPHFIHPKSAIHQPILHTPMTRPCSGTTSPRTQSLSTKSRSSWAIVVSPTDIDTCTATSAIPS